MPIPTDVTDVEHRLRELHAAGELRGAATLAIRAYGPEILGYLFAITRREQIASDAFSSFLEDVWRGLPGFAWRSSFRTWAYAVARNALHRQFRDGARGRRLVRLSEAPALDDLAVQIRTTTLPHLRSELKDRARRLRERLDPDEQTLLILRVDRRMTWPEIAAVMDPGHPGHPGHPGAPGDVGDLGRSDPARAAATLRKRYERIVARLREQSAHDPT